MRLRAGLIGKAQPIAAKSGWSGIFKRPVIGSVHVGPLGLAGDTIVDTENHGGFDQAVYAFGTIDYAFWQSELSRDLLPGTFGENLLIDGLDTRQMPVGDHFHIGPVLLEITYLPIPCRTLAVRMDDKTFPRRFLKSGRVGVYCRVIAAGRVESGMVVTDNSNGGRLAIEMLGRYSRIIA